MQDLRQTALERLKGNRPGPMRAAAAGVVAGGITGILAYRLLRFAFKTTTGAGCGTGKLPRPKPGQVAAFAFRKRDAVWPPCSSGDRRGAQ